MGNVVTFLDCNVNSFFVAVRTSLNSNPKQVREGIMSQVAQILACYRKNCSTPAPMGQLILPESMKLLPLYSNCVVKSDALQGGEYLAQVLIVLSQ